MRLFVAVRPPAGVVERLAALPRPSLPGLRWTAPEQWHVTLRFLGEADPHEAAAALAGIGAAGAGSARCYEAVLGPATVRFAGGRVVAVPVAGLDEVASAVIAATAGVGEPPEDRLFQGHLTLGRARGRERPGASAWAAAVGLPIEGRWDVAEVELVASRLHPHGARYETVLRVPLAPEGA